MSAPLHKRMLLNIVLLTLITLLTLLAWLGPDRDKHNPVILTDVRKDSIQRIDIQRQDKPPVVLEKQAGNWYITAPLHVYANDFRVNSILNLLGSESKKQHAVSSLQPAEFGLTEPAAILHLNDLEFRFGDREPISGDRYMQFGDTLHLLDDNTLPLLTQPIDAFIDHKLLPQQTDVTGFRLAAFAITRNERGGWHIEPDDDALGADDLQEWVDQWRYVQALRIEQRDAGSMARAPLLTVSLADNTQIEFRIVEDTQWRGFYRADLQLAYIMSEHSLDGLIHKPKPAPPARAEAHADANTTGSGDER